MKNKLPLFGFIILSYLLYTTKDDILISSMVRTYIFEENLSNLSKILNFVKQYNENIE